MTRRDDIAAAAMELVAEGGTHALTHRRVDRRLGLPEGTTSNHARSRRELMLLVVQQVAAVAHLLPPEAPTPSTVEEAVEQLTEAFEGVVARGVDTRARMSLSIDTLLDPELHALLTTDSPVRATVLEQARRLLDGLGVPDSGQRAIDLAGIMNGLFYDRLVGHGVHGTPVDAEAVLRAWLTGLGAPGPVSP
ncbi:TetR/AcrR family transcriptional regulator [Isoptericola sediminis]|uniref:TetR family transcriptional regulator n=1 Tax=Isoptericola sediminis TaxID=2733572 RepID=A0A849K344_9MICO|nr:TetR family transcriptional regulator [Isoptericola sediminis]NNU27201.1 TetR family transcriptional regulator [Isoptericola sediminis]